MREKSRMRRVVRCLCAFGACLAAPFSTAADPVPDVAAGRAEPAIESITVTAQRREQRIEDVPATVTAFTGEALEARGLHELNQLDRLVPNVKIQGAYGNASNPLITIRGVGLDDFSDNTSSPAGVYVDDVYLAAPPSLAFGLFDVERVEVLKGPQGTLFGRNTTAGAVQFVSRPPTETFETRFAATLESFDRNTYEAAVGGPITDTLHFRVSGLGDYGGDYNDNDLEDSRSGGQARTAGRIQLRYIPSESSELLLNLHGGHDASDLGQYQNVGLLEAGVLETGAPVPCAAALRGKAEPGDCVDLLGFSDRDGDDQAGSYNRRGRLDYDSIGGSLRATVELSPGVTLTSISALERFGGLRREEADASPNRVLEADYDVRAKQLSQEVRLAGQTDRLDWIAGLFASSDEIQAETTFDLLRDLRPLLGFQPDLLVATPRNRYDQDTVALAAFGHTVVTLTDRLSAQLGVRYSIERRDFSTQTLFVEDPAALAAAMLPSDGRVLSEFRAFNTRRLTWNAGLSYRVTPDLLAYASASTGFRSGGFNGGVPLTVEEVEPYDDEDLLAFELGLKGSLAGGRLAYSISSFYYDFRDLQVSDLTSTAQGIPVQVLTNAADSDAYGVDASLSAALAPGLRLNAGLGLLHAEFEDALIGGVDRSGKDVLNAPRVSLTTGIEYERELGSLLTRLAVDGAFQSREDLEVIQLAPSQSATVSEGSYWIVDARLTLGSAQSPVEVTLFAKNLFDEEPLRSTLTLAELGFAEYAYGLPRRFGITLTVRY